MTSHGIWYSYHIQTLVEVHILARYRAPCSMESRAIGYVWSKKHLTTLNYLLDDPSSNILALESTIVLT